MSAQWEPAEQVARNAEGQHVALIGGAWEPVDGAAKNAEGKFAVLRRASGAPKAATPPKSDQALAQTAEEESNAPLVQVGSAMMAPIEGVQQLAANIRGKVQGTDEGKQADQQAQGRAEAMKMLGEQQPLSRPVGTATDVATGALLPAAKIAEGAGWLGRALPAALTGLVYGGSQPVTSGKDFASEKAGQAVGGAAVGGGLSAGVDALTKGIPGIKSWVERLLTKAPVTGTGQPVGAGAGKVTDELQRQRDVLEGRKEPVYGTAAADTAKAEFEGRNLALKDKAFATGGKFDTGDTVKLIDELLLKNPDKQVQTALKEVKATIGRAIAGQKGQAAPALPQAGTTMTAQQFRQMNGQQQSNELGLPMADEVRQSINSLIQGKGEKALGPHTQEILGRVREKLLERAGPEYKEWLAGHAAGAREMEKLAPEVTVLGKTTTAQPGAAPLAGADAARTMGDVFGGKRSARDLQQMVEATAGNPEASNGLRSAYKEWLMPTKAGGAVNVNEAATRWQESRQAVKDSGLMDPTHYAAVDKVMADLMKSQGAAATHKTVATAAGYVAGLFVGRPGTTAMAARRLVGSRSEVGPAQVEEMITKALTNPTAAAALAAPPTPQNIQSLRLLLGEEAEPTNRAIGTVLSSRAATEQKAPKPKRPNPLGMRPAGL